MTLVRTVYVGGIIHADGTTITFMAPTRPQLVSDIDIWFYEYFKGLNQTVLPLPPLDDWDHSQEDDTYWSIHFPTDDWVVWTRHELMNFQ
jgi:hypothetical protein